MEKQRSPQGKPVIAEVDPHAAISGGEVWIKGTGFTENGRIRPKVRFGDRTAGLTMSSPTRLVVKVPEGVVGGDLTVEAGSAIS
ncbi:MAG: IPT/TIG domain-containing protein, partial [Terriglobia bacterium]